MPALLIYLLKANIALSLFYLAYRLGLRRLTFYVLNRFFLMGGILFSSVFPLVDVNRLFERHQEVTVYVLDLSLLQAKDPGITIWHVLVYIFWAGVTVMGIRFLIQLLSLWRLHRSAHAGAIRQYTVKLLQQPVTPFSFFRNIYINPSLHQPGELDAILLHEQVHVKQWHTLDVLAAELNNIFYWFNPGAWLMRTAVRENLEFITDRRMLQQGFDPKAYQYNLIKVSGIPYATAIANNFNFSHLKNRIKMMNKQRSAKYNIVRYLVLGSVVAAALLSLNYSRAAYHRQAGIRPVKDSALPVVAAPVSAYDVKNTNGTVTAVPFHNAPVAVIDTTPVPPPPPPVPSTGKKMPPPPPPVPPVPAGTKTPPPPPPAPPIPADKVHPPAPPVPPVPVVGPTTSIDAKDITIGGGEYHGMLFIDDVEVPPGELHTFNTKDITAMNVLKGDDAVKKYGDRGKDGVIFIYTKKNGKSPSNGTNFKYDYQFRYDTAINKGNKIRVVKSERVNANVQTNTNVQNNANVQTRANVQTSVNVKTSTNVKVDTSVNNRAVRLNLRVVGGDGLALADSAQPVYIVDGKPADAATLAALQPSAIETINVLKGDAATKLYGSRGANGVILVTTKKQQQP